MEKKPKAAPKEKKPSTTKTASHPPYFEMIKEALLAFKEKSGSSSYAIAKYMEEKHKSVLPVNFRKILSLQLKNSAAKGKLIKIKASYKLSSESVVKKDKTVTKKTVTKRKADVAKKVAPKKATPAKPKSIKSPAAKKSKKANAA